MGWIYPSRALRLLSKSSNRATNEFLKVFSEVN